MLDALERHSIIRTDVAALPTVGVEEFRQIAAGGGMVDAGSIYEELLATAKAREFETLANTEQFVLVESEWLVDWSGQGARLRLAQLGSPTSTSEMPGKAALVVPVLVGPAEQSSQAMWTAQGRLRHQGGARIRASVLGTTGPYDPASHTLTVFPIVIFSRLARQGVAQTRDDY